MIRQNLMTTIFIICFAIFSPAFAQEGAQEPVEQTVEQRIDVNKTSDIRYGNDPRNLLDIYHTQGAKNAPVVLMVHGGAWRKGDKTNQSVVENKMEKWTQEGFIFVSTNYRLHKTQPYNQAQDVRRAILYIQKNIANYGGNPNDIILMGHSSGAHLVALVNARPQLAYNMGVIPWKGAVILDTDALDVVSLMKAPHPSFYDNVFGTKLYDWTKSSPRAQLKENAFPMLLVCSNKRSTACDTAEAFSKYARTLDVKARVMPQDLSHKDINRYLGIDNEYTQKVDGFIQELLSN